MDLIWNHAPFTPTHIPMPGTCWRHRREWIWLAWCHWRLICWLSIHRCHLLLGTRRQASLRLLRFRCLRHFHYHRCPALLWAVIYQLLESPWLPFCCLKSQWNLISSHAVFCSSQGFLQMSTHSLQFLSESDSVAAFEIRTVRDTLRLEKDHAD